MLVWRVIFDGKKDRGALLVSPLLVGFLLYLIIIRGVPLVPFLFRQGVGVYVSVCLHAHTHAHKVCGVLGCEPRDQDETSEDPK